jgi:DNA-binding PadR family transcriptional regulator
MSKEQESSAGSIRLGFAFLDASRTDDIPAETLNEIEQELGAIPTYWDIGKDQPAAETTEYTERVQSFQALSHIERTAQDEDGWITVGGSEESIRLRVRDEVGIDHRKVGVILDGLEKDGYIELIKKTRIDGIAKPINARITEEGEAELDAIRIHSPEVAEAAEERTKQHLIRQIDFMKGEVELASDELGVDDEHAKSLTTVTEGDGIFWNPWTVDLARLSIAQLMMIPSELDEVQQLLENGISQKSQKKAA